MLGKVAQVSSDLSEAIRLAGTQFIGASRVTMFVSLITNFYLDMDFAQNVILSPSAPI